MAGTIEQFLEQHADADGNVSDEAMARLLTGGAVEGDTAAAPATDTGAPAAGTEATTPAPAAAPAAPAPAPAVDAPAATPPDSAPPAAPATAPSPAAAPAPAGTAPAESDAVILAKDGKHTIPYQKLVDARTEAQAAKARADALEAQLAERSAAPAAPPTPAAAPAPSTAAAPAAEIFGDYSDEAIKKGVDTLVAEAMGKLKTELTAELEPVKKQAAESAADVHFRTIYTKHPDADSIRESAEYEKWLGAQPSFVRETYERILKSGTTAQVVELLDTYKAAHTPATPAPVPAPAPTAAPAVDPLKKADQIIANVQPKAPVSLSDIPAGTTSPHDEAAAMAEMSPLDLMGKFEGKTPSQIEALMRRLV